MVPDPTAISPLWGWRGGIRFAKVGRQLSEAPIYLPEGLWEAWGEEGLYEEAQGMIYWQWQSRSTSSAFPTSTPVERPAATTRAP